MTKKPGRFSRLKKAALVAGAAATIGGAGWLGVSFNHGRPLFLPAYRAIRVIDGDTFETEEHQLIRLAASNAPELGMCGSTEAKKELEKLVTGQDIYAKTVFKDQGRSIAIVFTKGGDVDEHMLASGWAEDKNLQYFNKDKLKAANQKARREKLGIYSELCTQATNLKNPRCNIKGNVGDSGEKIYHYPGCANYVTTVVEFHHGDQWFCSEAEAKKAGFRRSGQCYSPYAPEKYQPSR